jgi:hypothetical protein
LKKDEADLEKLKISVKKLINTLGARGILLLLGVRKTSGSSNKCLLPRKRLI